jgi:hypothetical protein
VKNTVIIVFLAPTTCRVLGMTSAAKRANIFEDVLCVETRTCRLLRCHQNPSSLTPIKSLTFLLLPQHARLFEHHSRNEGPSAARMFLSLILSEEFL